MMYFPLKPTQAEVDARFKKDFYIKVANRLGKPGLGEKIYQDEINKYKASVNWKGRYARSYKIPEFYRDYWFGVDGSTDSFLLIKDGMEAIANYYIEQLKKAIEYIADNAYLILDHKESLRKTTVPIERKEMLLDSIKMLESGIQSAFNDHIGKLGIFSNPIHLRTTVFRIGAAQGTILRNDRTDAESTFENNYNYLKRSTGTAYFGKKAVWERMSQVVGKEVTEKNYKDLWADYGFFYCRILNGEITDIREI